jgi:flagellar biosynthetic protein FlhB
MFIVALGVGTLQVGLHVVPELVLPRWEKLSQGWSRAFSQAAVVRGLVAVVKVIVVGLIGFLVVRGRATQIMTLGQGSLAQAAIQAGDIAVRMALAMAATLVVIGVADYGFQRWRYEMMLRMTRQELKEEVRREEGDPQVRGRIRKMQREMLKNRMMRDVPGATVVVTNPTHLAVALKYDRGTMGAPRVVAKGAGYVASRIVDLARRHSVPVVERQAVAQALYKAVPIGQEIPHALFQAVAEVLAYVYRLRGITK